ncbi:carbohydrate-binding protein CenC [Serratia sp. L9]|uniref:carbohydrate-binding protein CenC n=1 Tax=Serratia sp. L9 TaxID=3423946 RepID=UPI003D678934
MEGSYPPGVVGNSEWQPISAVYTVPQQAARVTLGVYLRRGTTGAAWFDDIYACVRPSQPELLLWEDARNGRAVAQITVAQPQQVQLDSTLLTHQGVVVKTTRQYYRVEQQRQVAFPMPARLPKGEYRLRQQVIELTTRRALSREIPVSIGQEAAKVAIDEQGFILRGRQRFFPLGLYANMTSDEHLSRIAMAGFNTLLNYHYGSGKDPYSFFSQARKHGLQVIFSLKDLYAGTQFAPPTRQPYSRLAQWTVERLKDQPNLLAWYINDELGPEFLPVIEARDLQIKRLDRHHPTLQVLNKTGYLNAYFNSSDILATDPYPVGTDRDLTRTFHYSRLTKQAARGAKGSWIVIQIMDHAAYDSRRAPHQPSEQEVRNQAWLALIGGAQGLLFYSYTDLFYKKKSGRFSQNEFDDIWRGIANVAQEIASLEPYLLSGQSVILPTRFDAITARVFIDRQRAILLVANPFYHPQAIVLTLPDGWQFKGSQQIPLTLPALGTQALPLSPLIPSRREAVN